MYQRILKLYCIKRTHSNEADNITDSVALIFHVLLLIQLINVKRLENKYTKQKKIKVSNFL